MVGRQERLWRIQKKFKWLALFYHRNPAVIKFQYPRVFPGDQPLVKEPEDSEYEIVPFVNELLIKSYSVLFLNLNFRYNLAMAIETYVIKASHSKKFSSLSGPNKIKKQTDEPSKCNEDSIAPNHLKTKKTSSHKSPIAVVEHSNW